MFEKIAKFWRVLFNSIKTAYNKAFKEPIERTTQEWRDIERTNFLAIFVDKLCNYSLAEATFDIETDSTVAEPLKELVKDVEKNRYKITAEMLAEGDYYIFPALNEKGELYHSYLTQQQVRILAMESEKITEAYGVVDWYVDSQNNKTYLLLRHHTLDENGTLEISYAIQEDNGRSASVEQWDYLANEVTKLENANHIGFARFKSPASSRGLSAVYGVPLNFGCEEIEERIFSDLAQTDAEFKNAASKIFTDPRNLRVNQETGQFEMIDNIFAVQSRAGQSGANIDVYAPTIRYNEYRAKYVDDLMQYEQQVGVDRGFLTPFESGTAVTATEIRRANASTISTIAKVQSAFAKGLEDLIKADAVFLNIADDLYTLQIDWFDVFEDSDSQWTRLVEAHGIGAVDTKDITKWLYPNLTNDEIEAKIAEIKSGEQVNTDQALERILAGQ